jgi:hypothetical protein
VQTNLLDLRAVRFGLRANYVGLGLNLFSKSVPKKLSLVPSLISKQFALSPRHFASACGRH